MHSCRVHSYMGGKSRRCVKRCGGPILLPRMGSTCVQPFCVIGCAAHGFGVWLWGPSPALGVERAGGCAWAPRSFRSAPWCPDKVCNKGHTSQWLPELGGAYPAPLCAPHWAPWGTLQNRQPLGGRVPLNPGWAPCAFATTCLCYQCSGMRAGGHWRHPCGCAPITCTCRLFQANTLSCHYCFVLLLPPPPPPLLLGVASLFLGAARAFVFVSVHASW